MTDFPDFPAPPPPPPPPDHLMPPPGYVPYGGFGGVTGSFQPIRSLTKWLVILLGITLVVQLAALIVQLSLRGSATDFLDETITSDTFDSKLGTYLAVALLAALVGIAQLVVLILWTFRMAKNLGVLGRQPQAFKPGLTIAVNILGGCTLGILNFFMWREIWVGSDPETAPGDPTWKRRPLGGIVIAHLVLTLLTVAVGFAVGVGAGIAGFNRSNANDVAENLTDKFGIVLASGALQLALAVVFIMLVRQLAARHMQATREA
jgi:Domain of unknown function (DUF4328)